MADSKHFPSLERVGVEARSQRLKATTSGWAVADKREVLALADELLDAIPALEDEAAHGRRERVLDLLSKRSYLKMLVVRLDSEKGPSPEANDVRAQKSFKREPPSVADRYWGLAEDEFGREPHDPLDHPDGDDRGETGEFDPDIDDEGLHFEPDND